MINPAKRIAYGTDSLKPSTPLAKRGVAGHQVLGDAEQHAAERGDRRRPQPADDAAAMATIIALDVAVRAGGC